MGPEELGQRPPVGGAPAAQEDRPASAATEAVKPSPPPREYQTPTATHSKTITGGFFEIFKRVAIGIGLGLSGIVSFVSLGKYVPARAVADYMNISLDEAVRFVLHGTNEAESKKWPDLGNAALEDPKKSPERPSAQECFIKALESDSSNAYAWMALSQTLTNESTVEVNGRTYNKETCRQMAISTPVNVLKIIENLRQKYPDHTNIVNGSITSALNAILAIEDREQGSIQEVLELVANKDINAAGLAKQLKEKASRLQEGLLTKLNEKYLNLPEGSPLTPEQIRQAASLIEQSIAPIGKAVDGLPPRSQIVGFLTWCRAHGKTSPELKPLADRIDAILQPTRFTHDQRIGENLRMVQIVAILNIGGYEVTGEDGKVHQIDLPRAEKAQIVKAATVTLPSKAGPAEGLSSPAVHFLDAKSRTAIITAGRIGRKPNDTRPACPVVVDAANEQHAGGGPGMYSENGIFKADRYERAPTQEEDLNAAGTYSQSALMDMFLARDYYGEGMMRSFFHADHRTPGFRSAEEAKVSDNHLILGDDNLLVERGPVPYATITSAGINNSGTNWAEVKAYEFMEIFKDAQKRTRAQLTVAHDKSAKLQQQGFYAPVQIPPVGCGAFAARGEFDIEKALKTCDPNSEFGKILTALQGNCGKKCFYNDVIAYIYRDLLSSDEFKGCFSDGVYITAPHQFELNHRIFKKWFPPDAAPAARAARQ